jgi:sporulation protein YlmC with PRC-barrel domain
MMSVTSAIKGLTICATDGKIGTVSDLLFDDRSWRLRWLVVDTGNWLPGRLVLLHPSSLGAPDFNRMTLHVSLTRERVEASPDIQHDLPVSRQMEQGVYAYYGWDPGWGGGAFAMDGLSAPMSPTAPFAQAMAPDEAASMLTQQGEGDPHLRSVSATEGYQIHATDGEIGHVSNFLLDNTNWTLRYMIVDTGNWWPGKHVLLSPACVTGIDWVAEEIAINVPIDKVRASPEWDPASLIHGSYEARLREHYDWPPLM